MIGGEIIADIERELPAAHRHLDAVDHQQAEQVRRGRRIRAHEDLRVTGIDLLTGLAVGDRREDRIGEIVAHLREGQRQDREVDAGPAQGNVADHQPEQAGNHDREDQAGQDVVAEKLVHPHDRIGPHAEKDRVPETEIAGEPEQEIEADREDAVDREPLHQVGIARVELRERRALGEGLQQGSGSPTSGKRRRAGIRSLSCSIPAWPIPPSRPRAPSGRGGGSAG